MTAWTQPLGSALPQHSSPALVRKCCFGKRFGVRLGAGTEPFENGAAERFYPGLRTLCKAFRLRKRRLNPKGTLHCLQICKRFLQSRRNQLFPACCGARRRNNEFTAWKRPQKVGTGLRVRNSLRKKWNNHLWMFLFNEKLVKHLL